MTPLTSVVGELTRVDSPRPLHEAASFDVRLCLGIKAKYLINKYSINHREHKLFNNVEIKDIPTLISMLKQSYGIPEAIHADLRAGPDIVTNDPDRFLEHLDGPGHFFLETLERHS